MWLRARGEEAEYRIAGRHSVTLENLAHFFQVIFGKNYTLWLFCFESFKNCIANIFPFVNCWLCTIADSKVSFYILEVSLLVISKYKNMQENYEKWKIIQKELHIQKCNFMWEEIENDEGRNIKHHRKKNKKATKKTCRKKHKSMQEVFQNHARRNAKPCKKKYKTMPEEIQNTEGGPAAGERDRAAYKSKPPPSYHDSLCTVYSHPPLSSSRSWILTETTSSSSNLSQSRSWILITPLNNALSMVCLWRITSYIWKEQMNSSWMNVLIKKWKPIPKLAP